MKKRTVRIIAAALACLVLTGLSGGACAQARKAVRVGYFAFDGYHMQAEDGARSGYGYELLQHMAGFTTWKYEYVGYDKSWSDMQAMLERGEIDLLTSAQKTPEREARFDFSDEPVGTSAAILSVKAGDSRYMLEDYANWSGMRVGMLENNSRNEDFALFAGEHGFDYQPVFFGNAEDMLSELKAGDRIDAVVTSSLRSINGEWILASFAPSPFYIMVQKGNSALLEEVNSAVSQLFSQEPDICSRLMEKYYSPGSGSEIAYTVEERAHIEALRGTQLTAIINPDSAPYSFLENGAPAGILYDVAQEIIARSGLNVKFLELSSPADYEEHLRAGDYDLRFDAGGDSSRADELDCRLTDTYLDTPVSMLYLKNHSGFKTAACLKNGNLSCLDIGEVSGCERLVYCDSTSELVDAVLTGKCDVACLYSLAAELAVSREPTNRLAAEELHGFSESYAVAVKANLGPLLYSILHKAASSMSEAEVDEIVQRYSVYSQPPFSLVSYTYDYPVHMILFVAALFLFAGLIVSVVQTSRKRKRQAGNLAEEKLRSEQLGDALAAAKRADLAKQQFLSSMSHEIRTPLNAVIGYNTLAKNDLTAAKSDEERRHADMRIMDCLTKSEVASKQLLNIINDVLDMSAIESGKIKVASEPFDFRSMLSSLTVLFFSQAKAKGVDFEVVFEKPTEEWFVGDQLRINQILTNLLSNAVKFTPDGGAVRLTVVEKNLDDEQTAFHFEVTDTGIGMTAEYLSRIWTPFEQAEASISRRFGGSGLGLSITKSLVDIMDGSIAVESEAGVGTTFTVDLTLRRMEQPKKAAAYDFSGVNALVVDDDVSTCDYIRLLFERCEARCSTVTSGGDALAAFSAAKEQGEPYNVCLVDWRMPQMDGLETVCRLREIAGENVPIFIVTAYDFAEIAGRAEEAGVNMFISKPLFQSTLFDLLANICGKQSLKGVDRDAAVNFGGARVLLVEDNRMNMEVARRILDSSGLRVDCAWNGREAIDTFLSSKKGTYKAILMDVHMPEVDGYEATRAIRASGHPEAKTVPIIAMTADAFAEDVSEARQSGMNDHVSKPIDIEKLFDTLKKYISVRP